jgi:hypothetical protein
MRARHTPLPRCGTVAFRSIALFVVLLLGIPETATTPAGAVPLGTLATSSDPSQTRARSMLNKAGWRYGYGYGYGYYGGYAPRFYYGSYYPSYRYSYWQLLSAVWLLSFLRLLRLAAVVATVKETPLPGAGRASTQLLAIAGWENKSEL